jgi:uncharacterized protein YeaO (DUF488 family)
MTEYRTKRIYEPLETSDGLRVLVDRIWPRGVSKADAHIDRWAKELAPSGELRTWFNHDPARWEAFRLRYRKELQDRMEDLRRLTGENGRPVTLLFSARDAERNQAVVLKELLDEIHSKAGDRN